MANKIITEESLTGLFHALIGTPPQRELTEAQKEARLKRQCLYEIDAAKEAELVEQLAEVLGLPVTIELPEANLDRLHKALTG